MTVRQLVNFAMVLPLSILSTAVTAQFHDANGKESKAQDLADLLVLARAANLPSEDQERELPHIYKEIWTRRPTVADAVGVDLRLKQVDRKVTELSPEAFVAEFEASEGSRLPNAVYDVCLNLLGPHAPELAPQIIDSLRSQDRSERFAAIMLIDHAWSFTQSREKQPPISGVGGMRLTEAQRKLVRKSPLQVFLKPVFDLWMKDLDDHYVTLAAARFQSPRVRDFLVDTVVTGTDRYQYINYLSRLIAYEKPPQPLLSALSSPSARIRRAAAESLYDSGSPVLVPYIQPLAQDSDSKVRIAAAIVALKLKPADWEAVRPAVLALMSDPDLEVRGQVTGLLVDKEGKKLARKVLQIIQDASLSQLAHIYIYQAMVKITGSDFGYQEDFRRDYWQPTTPANRAAIRKFADWVDANVPEGSAL